MPRICYQLQNRAIDTDPATTILQTSLRAGIPHTHLRTFAGSPPFPRTFPLPGKRGEYTLYEVTGLREPRR
jgi:hypothetical protein